MTTTAPTDHGGIVARACVIMRERKIGWSKALEEARREREAAQQKERRAE